jgi:hypothetical protein
MTEISPREPRLAVAIAIVEGDDRGGDCDGERKAA